MRERNAIALDEIMRNFILRKSALPADLSRKELRSLAKLGKEPSAENFLEAVAMHPRSGASVIADIVREAPRSRGLLAAIAGLVKAPVGVLRELAQHPSVSVSESARINLLRKSLPTMRVDEIAHLLSEHPGDSHEDVSIRYAVASCPRMRKTILKRLAGDDVDAISAVACNALLKRSSLREG